MELAAQVNGSVIDFYSSHKSGGMIFPILLKDVSCKHHRVKDGKSAHQETVTCQCKRQTTMQGAF